MSTEYYGGAGDGQCTALKNDGDRCTNGVHGERKHCGTHMNVSDVRDAPDDDDRDWFRCNECGWQRADYEQGGGSPPYCSECGVEFPGDAERWSA